MFLHVGRQDELHSCGPQCQFALSREILHHPMQISVSQSVTIVSAIGSPVRFESKSKHQQCALQSGLDAQLRTPSSSNCLTSMNLCVRSTFALAAEWNISSGLMSL